MSARHILTWEELREYEETRCIYSWEINVRTSAMREYADVAKHDIVTRGCDVFVEWRNSWAGEWDMDDG